MMTVAVGLKPGNWKGTTLLSSQTEVEQNVLRTHLPSRSMAHPLHGTVVSNRPRGRHPSALVSSRSSSYTVHGLSNVTCTVPFDPASPSHSNSPEGYRMRKVYEYDAALAGASSVACSWTSESSELALVPSVRSKTAPGRASWLSDEVGTNGVASQTVVEDDGISVHSSRTASSFWKRL